MLATAWLIGRHGARSRVAFPGMVLSIVLCITAQLHADPIVVQPGRVTLRLSGLDIVLPADARQGHEWKLAASYSVDAGSFDGRDVIDEFVGDKIVAGNWILLGYFNAGDCAKVEESVEMEDAWQGETQYAGMTWAVRGGTYAFDSDLGKVPTLLLCGHRADHKDLLFHHFFVSDATLSREAMLASIPALGVFQAVADAWQTDRFGSVKPMRQGEVRSRGGSPIQTLHLVRNNIDLTLPDDGYVWISRPPAESDTTDWLSRMAPALPELEIELIKVAGVCHEILDNIGTTRANEPGPINLPGGWQVGPSLLVDGHIERTTCYQTGDIATIVGVFRTPDQGPGANDFAGLEGILGAIAAAHTVTASH